MPVDLGIVDCSGLRPMDWLPSLTLPVSSHCCPDRGSQGWTTPGLTSALLWHHWPACQSQGCVWPSLADWLLSLTLDPPHGHELAWWSVLTLAPTPSLPCFLTSGQEEGVWWASCSACCHLSPCPQGAASLEKDQALGAVWSLPGSYQFKQITRLC